MHSGISGVDSPPKNGTSLRPPKFGDPLEGLLPEMKGDPWKTIFDALIEKDKIQCDTWKEEVQNLLIFASLFSAISTAFVIESNEYLRPNSSDDTVRLLVYLAARLDNSLNITQPLVGDNEFSPTPSAIRVNVFWFMSLILSLSVVLIGTMSLQWLREHQRYDPTTKYETAVGIYNMRRDGMRAWHVRHIFTALPLLLQLALILFLVGVMEFLLSLSLVVAGPVIALIILTLLFYLSTTILPTLQAASFATIDISELEISSQCPFKSPQSLAFRRFALGSRVLFELYMKISRWIQHKWRLMTRREGVFVPFKLSHSFHSTYASARWENFDLLWVTERNSQVAQGQSGLATILTEHNLRVLDNLHDPFECLRSLAQQENREEILQAIVLCIQGLSKREILSLRHLPLGVPTPSDWKTHISSMPRMYRHEYLFSCLLRNFFPKEFGRPLRSELDVRALNYAFGGELERAGVQSDGQEILPPNRMLAPWTLLFELFEGLDLHPNATTTDHVLYILNSFFQTPHCFERDHRDSADELLSSLHCVNGPDFLALSNKQIYQALRENNSAILETIKSIKEYLQDGLLKPDQPNGDPPSIHQTPPAFIFVATLALVQNLSNYATRRQRQLLEADIGFLLPVEELKNLLIEYESLLDIKQVLQDFGLRWIQKGWLPSQMWKQTLRTGEQCDQPRRSETVKLVAPCSTNVDITEQQDSLE